MIGLAAETKEEQYCEEYDRKELLDYLIRRFGSHVMKTAYYYMRDRHYAEDIFQEVFCRVYVNLDKFRKSSSYFTWIFKITINLCRDYKTSAYMRRVFTRPGSVIENTACTDAKLFEYAEGGEVFGRVMNLPLKYRTVIALYYFEDLSAAEISGMLGISENLVRVRLNRGRNILKEVLTKEGFIYE